MPGLVPGIHDFSEAGKDVDGRDKPGHDARWWWRNRFACAGTIARNRAFAAGSSRSDRCRSSRRGRSRPPSSTATETAARLCDGRRPLAAAGRSEADVDPGYLKLLLAYEDRRFHSHAGVDPLALGRAALQLVTRGHIVSGGSTITMQLARLMEPRRERSIDAKLRQMVRAVELERQLSKDEILDLYLTLAPFGGNLEGVRAASLAYFGKEPKRLSLAEAALLVALPQSPETRRLDRHPDVARAARDRVLDRMVEDGRVARDDARRRRPCRCRGCASRCRSWRRIPPIRRSRP